MEFSYYKNIVSTHPEKNISEKDLYRIIQSGEYRTIIRKLRATSDRKLYDRIKRYELPAVTLSGVFSERGNDKLIRHSGLIQIDIDEDQVGSYRTLFNAVKKDPFSFICFRSPGGKGIKIVVRIPDDPGKHLYHFLALEKYYAEKYKVKIDKACKDISRALLLSWDPYIFRNPDARIFYKADLPKVKFMTPDQFLKKNWSDTEANEKTIRRILENIREKQMDITATYDDWLRIAFALSDTFGESGRNYFHEISRYHPEYDRKATDKFFSNCLKKNQHRIHFGTLVYIAKQYDAF